MATTMTTTSFRARLRAAACQLGPPRWLRVPAAPVGWVWRFCAGLAAMLMVLAAGTATAQTDPATAERLLRRSGLWEQLASVAPQVQQGLAEGLSQPGAAPPEAAVQRLRDAAGAAYAVDRLRSSALRTLSRELEPAHLGALLAWYESPEGLALTKLEEAAAADDRATDVVVADGRARLAAMPPERRARLQALLTEARVVDTTLAMTLNTVAGVRRGLGSVMPPGQGPDEAETRAMLAEQLPRLRPAFEQMLIAALAVAYADASDASLDAYVAFLRTPAGGHLNDVMQRVLDAMFLDAASELGRRLAPPRPGA